MVTPDELRDRLEQIHERIARAAQRAGRRPTEITLLGASKQVDPESILLAIECGLRHIGENRVQEAETKLARIPALRDRATWHMIGHLQKNKVRRALRLFDVIQSVDSIRLAQALERVAGEFERALPVYIEVNVAEEATKFGVRPKELFPLAETLAGCAHLRVDGLMTIPPYTDDPEAARPYFRQLRELLDQLNRRRILPGEIHGLSMGMSHDFEVAIEEGATLIRLGTAIWGPRPQP